MNRRAFLQTTSSAAVAGLSGAQFEPTTPAGHHVPDPAMSQRPNVIWIFGDQFRAQSLPFNGDPNARAPNLERAATNGVTLARNVSGFPLCCPFRGSPIRAAIGKAP